MIRVRSVILTKLVQHIGTVNVQHFERLVHLSTIKFNMPCNGKQTMISLKKYEVRKRVGKMQDRLLLPLCQPGLTGLIRVA